MRIRHHVVARAHGHRSEELARSVEVLAKLHGCGELARELRIAGEVVVGDGLFDQ
jgi:hypothetical protein